jgi:hypothetical protein
MQEEGGDNFSGLIRTCLQESGAGVMGAGKVGAWTRRRTC